MKVLVDTSVWSAALRKVNHIKNDKIIRALADLIQDSRVSLIGVIRQEILSGIKSIDQFEKLQNYLRAFPDITFVTEDFERAASLFNQCRTKGVQGSHIDFLICAVAINHDMPIFTLDKDFSHYGKHLPIKLYDDF